MRIVRGCLRGRMLQLHKGDPDRMRVGSEVARGLVEERGVHGEEGEGGPGAGDRELADSLALNNSPLR